MISVFTGSTADPVIAKIVANIVSAMIRSAIGRLEEMLESWSENHAVIPPTAIGKGAGPSESLDQPFVGGAEGVAARRDRDHPGGVPEVEQAHVFGLAARALDAASVGDDVRDFVRRRLHDDRDRQRRIRAEFVLDRFVDLARFR